MNTITRLGDEITDTMDTYRSSLPSVAVSFGGGGARGLAHIHIIEALDELGIRPVAISGSSIGAIMGAGMASGMSRLEIRDHALSSIGNRKAVANRIWGLRPKSVRGLKIGQFDLERVLRAFCRIRCRIVSTVSAFR